MTESRLDPEYIALLDAWQDLQVQVQALEAENARLQTDLRATQEGYMALNLQLVEAQRALETCQRARQESDDEMAREIRALKEQHTALRQPCTHAPPGSDPSCAWCRFRTLFGLLIPLQIQHEALEEFDAAMDELRRERDAAACTAAREEEG